MQNATEILRTARGLVASFDPTAGPDRTRAFLNDLTTLFTPGTAEHAVSVALAGGPLIVNGVDFSEQLTPSEVATVFDVDPKTVTRWADQGRVATIRTPGGHRRYSRAQVEALLAGEQA